MMDTFVKPSQNVRMSDADVPTVRAILRGRSVAIIGNAASLCALDKGREIDAHEVVIRMNRGIPPSATSHGRRTDVLAFSLYAKVAGLLPIFGAAVLVHMSPKRRDLTPADRCEFYPLAWWDELAAQLGARPSTGAMVADLVRRSGPRDVRLFGFDGYRSGSFYLERPHVGPHDYIAEAAFLEAVAEEHGWNVSSHSAG